MHMKLGTCYRYSPSLVPGPSLYETTYLNIAPEHAGGRNFGREVQKIAICDLHVLDLEAILIFCGKI